jgi:hypothetical protein
MDTVNEIDNLFKHAMQFNLGEIPEPNPGIQKKLRRKVKGTSPVKNTFMPGFLRLLGLDVKLYYLGFAVSAMAVIFIVLRNANNEPKHSQNDIIIADTNAGSYDTNIGANPRYDTFQAKKSALRIY